MFSKEIIDCRVAICVLYTSDAADDLLCGGVGAGRVSEKKTGMEM